MKTAKEIGELSLADARRMVAHLQWCLAIAVRPRAGCADWAAAQADVDLADKISTEVAQAEGRRVAALADTHRRQVRRR